MATGNEYNTLRDLLKGIADALRAKIGTTAQINAQDFPSNIAGIPKAAGNASTSDVLSGVTFSNKNGGEQTGTMTNNGAVSKSISPGGSYTVPAGYHNGSGIVSANMPSGNAGTGDVLSGKTFSNSSTNGATGTMTNRGAWSTTINPGGSVTIPAGYHSGGGKVSVGNSSRPSVLYHNSSSTDGATSLQYSFPSYGTYRVCATACCIAHNGNQTEFYTNGSISTTHHTNMWSKGGGTYGGIGEAPLGTVLIFMGDITASGGQIVKILTKETQSFVTLFVERLP